MKVISYIITELKDFLLLPDVVEQCLIHMRTVMLDDLLPCKDTVNNAYYSIMNNHDAALCTTQVRTYTCIVIMVSDVFSLKTFIIKQHTGLKLRRLLEQG